jgi:hypothetical protein
MQSTKAAAGKGKVVYLSRHILPLPFWGKMLSLRFLFYYLKFSGEQLPASGNYLLSLF